MRIVQTFWTGGQDPLKHGFGWLHAEYNLMSWALSCLSLRRHYDEVVLYTDTAGKRILIDELHLPYTDVQVVYDDMGWLPQHWAQAKIKTYSMQTRPFLHVDGDIYVSRPLKILRAAQNDTLKGKSSKGHQTCSLGQGTTGEEEIMGNSDMRQKHVILSEAKNLEEPTLPPLIAQNREIGTIYYRRMLDRLLCYPEVMIPEIMQKALSEEHIPSYNMGFFGGSDLNFIHRYCDKAFRFMEENRMNDPAARCSRVVCNIFFEQILFAALADAGNRDVASILGKTMIDKGYTAREFCDLLHFRKHSFLHIVGPHKRNADISDMLDKRMRHDYPEYYKRISSLFAEQHGRILTEGTSEMYAVEKKISNAFSFIDALPEAQEDFVIERNPFAHQILSGREGNGYTLIVPAVGLREQQTIPLKQLGLNILATLDKGGTPFRDLKEMLKDSFTEELKPSAAQLMEDEVSYLLFHGVLTATPDY